MASIIQSLQKDLLGPYVYITCLILSIVQTSELRDK